MKSKIILSLIFGLIFFSGVSAQVPSPAWEWVKQFHNGGSQNRAITLDADGNIYTTGYFIGTVDFDPDTGVFNLTSNNNFGIFIMKTNSSGNLIWVKSFVGTQSSNSAGNGIVVDSNKNVFITGEFSGTIDFNPDSGVYNLTAIMGTDIFNCKLDSNGHLIWVNKIGSDLDDYGASISIDRSGFIYTTGSIRSIADFDPGSSSFYLGDNNYWTAYILKLDSVGNFVWAKEFPTAMGATISLDSKGNVITSGSFYGVTDFDPNGGMQFLNSGGYSIFISKLSKNGNFLWADGLLNQNGNTIPSTSHLTVTHDNSILITGTFHHTIDFDPGVGYYPLSSNNSSFDIYISKLDSNGNFLWAKKFGNSEEDYGSSITTDVNSNIICVGRFRDTVDFDPGVGVHNCNSFLNNSTSDLFVLKLDSNGNFYWVKTAKGWNEDYGNDVCVNSNNEVYVTGSFTESVISFGGIVLDQNPTGVSEHAYTAKISVCSTESLIVDSACNYYISPTGNLIWTISGIFSDTLHNNANCDSIIVIDLTIFATSSGQTISSCDNYTSPSGNHTWTTSGIYSDTIPNAAGCDSIITINLTINSVDTSVIQTANTLTSTVTAATYQWLNCDIGFAAINGATNQSFTATANGNYAVAITQNGCTDTSSCYAVTGVGVEELAVGNLQLAVYPNPSENQLTVYSSQLAGATITVTDILGRDVIASSDVIIGAKQSFNINVKALVSGIYFLKVQIQNGEIAVRKFVKE